MSRPYLSKSIDQLEALFESSKHDESVLKQLASELGHRKTSRAKTLAERVESLLQKQASLRRSAHAVRTAGQNSPIHADKQKPLPDAPTAPTAKQSTATETKHPRSEPIDYNRPNFTAGQPERPVGDDDRYTNRTTDILDSWSALEVLSPQTFRRPADLAGGMANNIVSISNGQLPWANGPARSRPNFRVYYHIVLGTIPAEPAFEALVERFKDSRLERPSVQGEIVLASVLVDKDGLLAGESPISVSAFGWGLPVALQGSLKGLAAWTKVESRLVAGLSERLAPADKTETPAPITWTVLQGALSWLVSTLGLQPEQVKGPAFLVASYIPFRSKIVPDSLLLNSFYLRDLARARDAAEAGALPSILGRYLDHQKQLKRHDVLKDDASLEEAAAPSNTPIGRWPTPVNHAPALLQQIAVNLASRLNAQPGILGINGPPGTGKSTLLRDIVADLITRRASAMCSFSKPEDAFKVGWSKRARGETQLLHTLDSALRGFEMVVASSNNKAVENVSTEIPALSALPAGSKLRYFEPLSNDVFQRDTWGLVAAVLGNAKNRSAFRRAFWTESNNSFKRYLEKASGVGPVDPSFPPGLAEACDAPSDRETALLRWNAARERYLQTAKRVSLRLSQLEMLRRAILDLPGLKVDQQSKQSEHQRALATTLQMHKELDAQSKALAHANTTWTHHSGIQKRHEASKPSWFTLKRMLGNQQVTTWQKEQNALHLQGSSIERSRAEAISSQAQAYKRLESARSLELATKQAWENARNALASAMQMRKDIVVGEGAHVLDEDFLQMPHQDKQKALPWLDRRLQDARSDVFEAAMEVHKAFIDAAAVPLLHNLNGLLGFNFNLPPDRQHLAGDLWSSFFLVVPVISTTFASVERMFGSLPAQTFGWLLIDEAGQATPQAAVGALLRCRRAVVVGDPLQIEPVVPLPDVLTSAVLREFNVEPERFSAPASSVQTLADEASAHCATFSTSAGSRTVGSPLLVHRRCSSPMFDISNKVAYGGLMVQAKPSMPSSIREVLGPSHWIDVRGSGREKYSPYEGDALIGLLRRLRSAGVAPDFYIVTPFVAVQDGLRQLVQRDGVLKGWVDDPATWAWEHIGTVHTVQGREAEAVFFVLGAPDTNQHGARQWAGAMPNLLNVAVTRAKEAVYVIGNRELWSAAGKFNILDQLLPPSTSRGC